MQAEGDLLLRLPLFFRRHPERSEGPLYLLFVFAVAVVVAVASLAVIPEGDLLLPLPLPVVSPSF
jgi:hypothetical protein